MMDSSYPRYAKAQKYLALGFYPVDCFAGRVRIKGKRLTRQSFSIYAPNSDMKCCGALVKSARTDQHGHFFAEPLKAGEYFAKFEVGGLEYVSSFAVISDYNECSAGYFVELDFSDVNSFKFQEYMILDDDGELCSRVEGDPSCFRK